MAETSSRSSTAAPVSTPQPNPLSKKLQKILQGNLDNDKETLEALEVLSTFLGENTLQARRNLRSDLEKRSLVLNESFLKCMEQLVGQIQGIQEDVSVMKVCCDDMGKRLSSAKSQTSDLLRETAQLQNKSKHLEMRSKVVDAFLKKFELTSSQLQLLAGSSRYSRHIPGSGHIGEEFFEAMIRVKQIHEDCKILLRTSQQRAGLEIMESMAMHLESAYEQLYHWTQSQCRTMNTDTPETSANLRRALSELQNRPILLQYCLDEYSIARRNALVRCFIDALTREGNSGRPIELHSHDPVRYCGDMLGWLHQAIATENDHISGLLMDQNREKTVPILSMVTEGACRPLHVRIEQVVISTSAAVVAYQLVSLLRYYAGVFQGHLGSGAPLVRTVTELSELQSKMFYSTLNVQTSKLLESVEMPLPDLSPTSKANEILAFLQGILSSRDMTVLASDTQDQDLKLILSSCIDPLIQYCNECVLSLGRLERAVYLINTLYLIQNTISLYEFTDAQVESLEFQIQSHMNTLIEEQEKGLLEAAGLSTLHHAVLKAEVSDEHFKIEDKTEKIQKLISAPEQHQLVQCQLLSSTRLRDDIQHRSLEQFFTAYKSVYSAIVTEKGETTAKLLLPYTPEQVMQILSL